MDVATDGSPYIGHIDLVPPSPRDTNLALDFDHHSDTNAFSPPYTPNNNSSSYYNSPYSQHSELDFSAEEINFDILADMGPLNDYEPVEYDAAAGSILHQQHLQQQPVDRSGQGLLMFTQDSDYMSPHYSPDLTGPDHSNMNNRARGSPFDHSSPSSNGDPNDNNNNFNPNDGRHSRASSVGSHHYSPRPTPSPLPQLMSNNGMNNNNNHPHPHPSPRLDVAASFGNMSVHTPNWGTQPLPSTGGLGVMSSNSNHPSPLHHPLPLPSQKPQSPPRLLMPDGDAGEYQYQHQPLGVPRINAPSTSTNGDDNDDEMNDGSNGAGGLGLNGGKGVGGGGGSGGGPMFHIVPATPISGGGPDEDGHGLGHGRVPFQQTLATLVQGL